MMTTDDKPTNDYKTSLVYNAVRELLEQSLRRGYHGLVAVEVSVQDGVIQNVRRRSERMER